MLDQQPCRHYQSQPESAAPFSAILLEHSKAPARTKFLSPVLRMLKPPTRFLAVPFLRTRSRLGMIFPALVSKISGQGQKLVTASMDPPNIEYVSTGRFQPSVRV